VTGVAFNPDGTTLLTVCKDASVRLWDVATARQLGLPMPHSGTVRCWAFGPDGRSALTGADRVARVWHLSQPLTGEAEHVVMWAQVVSRRVLDAHGVVRELDEQSWQQRRRQLDALGGPKP
jgi:WD40 repeat protein